MSNPLKKQWQSLKQGRPGHRFQMRYDAGQKTKKDASMGFKFLRIFRMLLALAAVAIGIILIFIPGPAILFFFVAGSLLAAESITVARFLDWTELKFRAGWTWCKRYWGKLHFAGKIAVAGLAGSGAGGCAYAAYRLMTG